MIDNRHLRRLNPRPLSRFWLGVLGGMLFMSSIWMVLWILSGGAR